MGRKASNKVTIDRHTNAWRARYRAVDATTGERKQYARRFTTKREAVEFKNEREAALDVTDGVKVSTWNAYNPATDIPQQRTYQRPQQHVQPIAVGRTWADLAARFLVEHDGRKGSRFYPMMVERIGRDLDGVALSTLTIERVLDYRRTLDNARVPCRRNSCKGIECEHGKTLSPVTVHKILTVAGTIAQHGVRIGWLPVNPFREVRKPTIATGSDVRTPTLDPTDVEVLLEEIRNPTPTDLPQGGGRERESRPDVADVADFVAGTGARLGEATGLLWRNVDLDARTARVTGKTGARMLHLSQRALDVLDRIDDERGTTGHVFRNQGGKHFDTDRGRNMVSQRVTEAAKRSGLYKRGEAVGIYALRHYVGTQLAQSGMDLATVRDYLGHKNISTTQRYLHSSSARLQQAAHALDAL